MKKGETILIKTGIILEIIISFFEQGPIPNEFLMSSPNRKAVIF